MFNTIIYLYFNVLPLLSDKSKMTENRLSNSTERWIDKIKIEQFSTLLEGSSFQKNDLGLETPGVYFKKLKEITIFIKVCKLHKFRMHILLFIISNVNALISLVPHQQGKSILDQFLIKGILSTFIYSRPINNYSKGKKKLHTTQHAFIHN